MPNSSDPVLVFASVTDLLAAFHEQGVRYCHFKSNIHVGSGITGKTDLDLLIDRRQRPQVIGLFHLHGFRHFRSGPQTTYPSVEDWIGAGPDSPLFHLHVHWDLTLGEEFLKGYSLPLVTRILDNRSWNSEHEIFTASPESELLLLVIRVSLRRPLVRSLAELAPWVSRETDYIREAEWLLESASPSKFFDEFANFFSDELLAKIWRALEGSPSRQRLLPRKVQTAIRKYLSSWRTYSAFSAFFRRRRKVVANNLWGKLHRYLNLPFVARRQPQAGGLIIAIVGPDNSGKSTQSKNAVKWLSGKIDAHYVYLGSGNGPKSWERVSWEALGRAIDRRILRSSSSSSSESASSADPKGPAKLAFRARMRHGYKNVFAILLALEKARKVRFAVRARNRGSVVITDRFPQLRHPEINDGPMLRRTNAKIWSQWELRILEQVNKIEPDVVIRLRISEEVVRVRTDEFDSDRFQMKTEVFDDLELWPRATRLDVNADENQEVVERAVKSAIWASL